jgi:beta-lactam-binding protein with PASTA domain
VGRCAPSRRCRAWEQAGCRLGDVTTGPDGPGDAGTIANQTPPAGDKVPTGTDVDVTIDPATCVVPNLAGKTQAEAKAALEAAGCLLGDVTTGPTDPNLAGKVTDQSTKDGTSVPRGTEVDITVAGPGGTNLDTQVLGETATRAGTNDGAGTAPALARTGGVALAGMALWLMVSGLLTSAAGSARAWSVLRRRKG